MNKYLILLMSSQFIACGGLLGSTGKLPLKYGMEQTKDVGYASSQTDIQAGLDIIFNGFDACFGWDVRSVVDGVTIKFCDKIAPRPSTGELNTVCFVNGETVASGYQIDDLLLAAWRGKLFRTALAHEFMHYFGGKINGKPDGKHKNSIYWDCVREINGMLKRRNL